jgi:hypothetical protein
MTTVHPTDSSDKAGEADQNGAAAAAILAAGIGCLAVAVLTILVEASERIKGALTLSSRVGPLSGKVAGALAIWLIAWAALHLAWRRRTVPSGAVYVAALVLILLAMAGTYPGVFHAFSH